MIKKFRVWDKDAEEMIMPSPMCPALTIVPEVDEQNLIYILLWDPNKEMEDAEVTVIKNGIAMQVTGLLDKNKKEIYESDVIQDSSFGSASSCVIKYEDGAFYANAVLDPEDGANDLLSEYASSAVVVGNIYENPELIKPC